MTLINRGVRQIFARCFNLYAVRIVERNRFLRTFAADFNFALEVQHRKSYIMKKLLSFLFVFFVLGSVYAAEP
ncbi:MAG: hypothetical protein J6Y24_16775, partial [Bacteroidales bacterium]|nr:hypothetical protein [Bacteroidales bacterium]